MLYKNKYPEKISNILNNINYSPPTKKALVINTIGQPILNENIPTFNYFGESIFENNSDQDQTYETPVWSKSITNEASVSLSLGINLDAEYPVDIDAFGIKVSVNFNQTVSTAEGTKQTITAPNTPIIVKPHKKMQVLVCLNAFVSSQNITMDSDISRAVSFSIILKSGPSIPFSANVKDIFEYYKEISQCPDSLSLNSDGSIHVKNEASISNYNVGTLWKVITNPIN